MNGDKTSALRPSAADPMNDLRLDAARKRLSESAGQADAIEGVREIVANFLGSEEISLFRVDPRGESFPVYWSFGIDPAKYDLLRALGEVGLRRVMRGECHVELPDQGRSCGSARVQAFIPLRLANQTIAILAILRLLPQKVAFDRHDMELFKLLSEEAAKPLFGPGAQSASATEDPGMRA